MTGLCLHNTPKTLREQDTITVEAFSKQILPHQRTMIGVCEDTGESRISTMAEAICMHARDLYACQNESFYLRPLVGSGPRALRLTPMI